MEIVTKLVYLLLAVGSHLKLCLNSKQPRVNHTFIAAILRRGTFLCGGTVVSRGHILTAASCCYHSGALIAPNSMTVMAGTSEWRQGRKAHVSKCVPHEKFDPNTTSNDVAIVVLDRALVMDNKVSTITLNPFKVNLRTHLNTQALVWEPKESPVKSVAVNITIIPTKECKAVQEEANDNHICVTGRNQKTFCDDATGGPLLLSTKEKVTQVGIINYQEDFCNRSLPQLSISISPYYTWIRTAMKKSRVRTTFRSQERGIYESIEKEVKTIRVVNSNGLQECYAYV